MYKSSTFLVLAALVLAVSGCAERRPTSQTPLMSSRLVDFSLQAGSCLGIKAPGEELEVILRPSIEWPKAGVDVHDEDEELDRLLDIDLVAEQALESALKEYCPRSYENLTYSEELGAAPDEMVARVVAFEIIRAMLELRALDNTQLRSSYNYRFSSDKVDVGASSD